MSSDDAKELLEDELGQLALPGTSQRVAKYWDLFSDKDDLARMAYVRLATYRYLLARYHNLVDITQGQNKFNYSQLTKHIMGMYNIAEAEVKALDPGYGIAAMGNKKLTPSMPDRLMEIMVERGYVATDDTRP